MMNSNFAVGR